MSTVLDTIARHNLEIIAEKKLKNPLGEVKARAYECEISGAFPFRRALSKMGISFICEVKKASPSKGIIAEDFPYLRIAREYEQAGADAISCLTEPKWFMGRDEYAKEIASAVSVPVLRKDFTVDEYMIYEAKLLGASAILLICALLDEAKLKAWRELAEGLGMDALVEAHDEAEVEVALKSGAKIVGVNNRDLKTFNVDVNNSTRYRSLVPPDVLFVSESGISSRADIEVLEKNGTNAVLIGEVLMRSPNKKQMLDSLRGV